MLHTINYSEVVFYSNQKQEGLLEKNPTCESKDNSM